MGNANNGEVSFSRLHLGIRSVFMRNLWHRRARNQVGRHPASTPNGA
jgi:hypothetical protein